jgi:hypothetical protein
MSIQFLKLKGKFTHVFIDSEFLDQKATILQAYSRYELCLCLLMIMMMLININDAYYYIAFFNDCLSLFFIRKIRENRIKNAKKIAKKLLCFQD